jgi:glycosyltransferase involved in cell wall biosynthesis
VKILFDCSLPFSLAHGGQATQIQQTMAALQELGVEAEPVRWWDDRQGGDIIHYFGRMPVYQIRFAQAKGIKVILAHLFSAACNRSDFQLRRAGWILKLMQSLPLAGRFSESLGSSSFAACDLNTVGLEAERQVLNLMYHIPRERVAVVPLGLEPVYLKAQPGDRHGDYLVCAGTITQVKNCIPLARLARAAEVPILFVGKPYSERDAYWIEFKRLIDGGWVRYQGHVTEPAAMVALLQRARGAVIMSQYENWCLAAHEAAACGLPVLLPPKRWALERFGNQAHYLDNAAFNRENIDVLRRFYRDAPDLPAPAIRLLSWHDTARQLKEVYQRVLES